MNLRLTRGVFLSQDRNRRGSFQLCLNDLMLLLICNSGVLCAHVLSMRTLRRRPRNKAQSCAKDTQRTF